MAAILTESNQHSLQTKNKINNFPRAMAEAEVGRMFYPTKHFFICDSLVFGSNAKLEILFYRGGKYSAIFVPSGVS